MSINYLEEYEEIALKEMDKYITEAKEGVYKDNYYLRDHIQIPIVSKELTKPKTQDTIIELVSSFLDDHVEQLRTSGPVYTFTFSEKEIGILYDLFKVNDEMLLKIYKEMVNETYFGNISLSFNGWIKNCPCKLLLNAILIESLQKKYEDMIESVKWIYAFIEYPIVYRIFWEIGVKEDLMNYTIEHLGSKYKIANMKNIQELIYYHSNKVTTSMNDTLLTGLDNVYMDFIQRIRNQFKNNFRNIANAYYDNDKKGVTQHVKDSTFDDGTLTDQEGHITNIARAVDNTINKFSTTNVNATYIKIVAEPAKLDRTILTNFITQILKSKNNNLYKLLENIITSYFNRNPTNISLGSQEFLNFGLALYKSIGTSKDPMYIEIKSIINYWMNDILEIRKQYSSEGTIISYTRAIFNYIIFMIQYYN